jgi:phage terminase large subunit-like protein
MERTRAELGTYWFSALYQQAPRPLDGLMFRREDFRYFTSQEADQLYCLQRDSGQRLVAQPACVHFQTVDVAASEKQTADYTVVSTWAATPDGDLLLLDCQRQRFELLDVGGAITRAYQRHRPSFVGVEDFGHGLGVVQELLSKGLPIRRLTPDKDKLARALVAQARYRSIASTTCRGPRG